MFCILGYRVKIRESWVAKFILPSFYSRETMYLELLMDNSFFDKPCKSLCVLYIFFLFLPLIACFFFIGSMYLNSSHLFKEFCEEFQEACHV